MNSYGGDVLIISSIVSIFIPFTRKWMWVYIIVFLIIVFLIRFHFILSIFLFEN